MQVELFVVVANRNYSTLEMFFLNQPIKIKSLLLVYLNLFFLTQNQKGNPCYKNNPWEWRLVNVS